MMLHSKTQDHWSFDFREVDFFSALPNMDVKFIYPLGYITTKYLMLNVSLGCNLKWNSKTPKVVSLGLHVITSCDSTSITTILSLLANGLFYVRVS